MKRKRSFENPKQQLGLFSGEDTILKRKGRLGNAPLDIAARYPILLPRRHHVTRLIVEACHRKVNHGGVKETLAELRSKYWVPKGIQLVKKTTEADEGQSQNIYEIRKNVFKIQKIFQIVMFFGNHR